MANLTHCTVDNNSFAAGNDKEANNSNSSTAVDNIAQWMCMQEDVTINTISINIIITDLFHLQNYA
jgi:hypothetical protein